MTLALSWVFLLFARRDHDEQLRLNGIDVLDGTKIEKYRRFALADMRSMAHGFWGRHILAARCIRWLLADFMAWPVSVIPSKFASFCLLVLSMSVPGILVGRLTTAHWAGYLCSGLILFLSMYIELARITSPARALAGGPYRHGAI